MPKAFVRRIPFAMETREVVANALYLTGPRKGRAAKLPDYGKHNSCQTYTLDSAGKLDTRPDIRPGALSGLCPHRPADCPPDCLTAATTAPDGGGEDGKPPHFLSSGRIGGPSPPQAWNRFFHSI
jgi:hypothetical protein